MGAVALRPAYVFRGLVLAEAFIGVIKRIEEHRHLTYFGDYAGGYRVKMIPAVSGIDRHAYVEAASGKLRYRLWRKVGRKAVPCGYGLYNGDKGHRVVSAGKGIGIYKIYLVLARAFLVVGAFGLYAHALHIELYLTPYVLAPVYRSDVHVSGIVMRDLCGIALLVVFKQIKLHGGAEFKA